MFDASRPDRALLAGIPFGETWLALRAPTAANDMSSRLAMYRLLIERGNPHGAFGPGDALSPWWGYASQLAWQHASGRLGGHSIDPESWWGACNYALSVIPYVAAGRLGLVPLLATGPEIAPYATALAAWHVALSAARVLRPGDDLEPARRAWWLAHLESIEIATHHHAPRLAQLPPLEQRFARGWVRMVELFGAAALRTDLERLVAQAAALPARILDEATIEQLDRAERRMARRVIALGDRPRWRWNLEVRVWRRIMRTRAARDEAELLIAGLLGGHPEARKKALRYAF